MNTEKKGEVKYTSALEGNMHEEINEWVAEKEVKYMGSSCNRFRSESNWEREMEMRRGQ